MHPKNGLIALSALLVPISGWTAEPPVRVCNRMTITLADVTFVGAAGQVITLPAELGPGECFSVSGLAAGMYSLQFIERDGSQAAMCRRILGLPSGGDVTIAPGDGAQCMM